MKFEWEEIYSHHTTVWHKKTYRAKIFGGWLINHLSWTTHEGGLTDAIVFVPDPNYEWKIEET